MLLFFLCWFLVLPFAVDGVDDGGGVMSCSLLIIVVVSVVILLINLHY